MFFQDYKSHSNSKIRPELFWEYDMTRFDWREMKQVVIHRVIERGKMEDFYGLLNLYGIEEVINCIKRTRYLNPKDLSFVHSVFHIPKKELTCYTKKRLHPMHGNF